MGHRSRRLAALAGVVWLIASDAGAVSLTPLQDVADIAAGESHSCALDRSGRVFCWGENLIGQLGLGAASGETARPSPVPLPTLSAIRAIASGFNHSCAITGDRGLRCWGLNDEGQLGIGSDVYSLAAPGAVTGLAGPVQSVATGSSLSCAVYVDGRVGCWGGNGAGQLGDGGSASRNAPGALVALGQAASAVTAGSRHACALLVDGSVRCWGANESGQLGDGSTSNRATPVAVQGLPGPVRAIAATAAGSCALTQAGALFCWGPQFPFLPFDGGSTTARAYPGFGSGLLAIDGGTFHVCALTDDAAIRCLGDNFYGQLGTGPIDGSLQTDRVVDLAAGTVQLSAGGLHSCARSVSGSVQCWGWNHRGQIGVDRISLRLAPTQVAGLDGNIAGVAAGERHGCALTTGGAVKCWGSNLNGELGDGSTRIRLTPVDTVGLGSGVRAISAGAAASCAITAQRSVRCWGANFDGRLGNGSNLDSSVPVDVVGLGAEALALTQGRDFGCALLAGGTVKCWGDNGFGQLGTGDTAPRPTAVAVDGLPAGPSSLSAGYYHACAVVAGGGIRCWGNNQFGQLGDGSFVDRTRPVAVTGLSGPAIAVGTGIAHTCALLQGGAVQCWGAASFGTNLGDGSPTDRAVPGDVPALRSGVVEISLGGFHSCARLASGALQCWGSGGPIGDNAQVHRPTPVPVAGLNTGVQDVSASFGGHTCAVVAGAAKCWGNNTLGQVGDGSTESLATAHTVVANPLARRVAPVDPAANAASAGAKVDASGRFVVFESDADNLVGGDSNDRRDVFRRDRESGAVVRVSLDDAGAQISGDARQPSVSGNGHYVVFVAPTAAVGKVHGESADKRAARLKNTGNSVFLRNLLTGTTQLVGPASSDAGAAPRIAPDASAVVFSAPTANAAEGTLGQSNIYLVPLTLVGDALSLGAPACVSCKSTAGGNVDGDSSHAVVSDDGRYVAWQTKSSNAIAGTPPPCPAGSSQVLLRDLLSGTVQRLGPPAGTSPQDCGEAGSRAPSMDASGQVVAWQTDDALAGADANDSDDVYVWRSGEADPMRLSQGGSGTDTSASAGAPQVSGDGRQVAFTSAAQNHDLGFPDNNDAVDLHVVSLAAPLDVLRLSRGPDGSEANAASAAPALNFDGSVLAFDSRASSFLAGSSSAGVFTRSNPQAVGKRSETWWVPSESGWGMTVFDQGNLLAPTWYTYDSDGEPTWFLISGAFPQGGGRYSGRVLRLTGTPYDRINGPATTGSSEAGSMRFDYVGEDRLVFGYSVDGFNQSKTLQRFPFGARSFTCSTSPQRDRSRVDNYTDLWTGVEGGWGVGFLHIDALLIAVWYTYDLDGEAVFFVINASRQSDGSYAGPVRRQRNGTPFSAIDGNNPSPGVDPVGSARFVFADGQTATFSFDVGGVQRSHGITRLLVGSEAQACRTETRGTD